MKISSEVSKAKMLRLYKEIVGGLEAKTYEDIIKGNESYEGLKKDFRELVMNGIWAPNKDEFYQFK